MGIKELRNAIFMIQFNALWFGLNMFWFAENGARSFFFIGGAIAQWFMLCWTCHIVIYKIVPLIIRELQFFSDLQKHLDDLG